MELAANVLDMNYLNLCRYAERRTLSSFENNPQVMKNVEHLFAVLCLFLVCLFICLFIQRVCYFLRIIFIPIIKEIMNSTTEKIINSIVSEKNKNNNNNS